MTEPNNTGLDIKTNQIQQVFAIAPNENQKQNQPQTSEVATLSKQQTQISIKYKKKQIFKITVIIFSIFFFIGMITAISVTLYLNYYKSKVNYGQIQIKQFPDGSQLTAQPINIIKRYRDRNTYNSTFIKSTYTNQNQIKKRNLIEITQCKRYVCISNQGKGYYWKKCKDQQPQVSYVVQDLISQESQNSIQNQNDSNLIQSKDEIVNQIISQNLDIGDSQQKNQITIEQLSYIEILENGEFLQIQQNQFIQTKRNLKLRRPLKIFPILRNLKEKIRSQIGVAQQLLQTQNTQDIQIQQTKYIQQKIPQTRLLQKQNQVSKKVVQEKKLRLAKPQEKEDQKENKKNQKINQQTQNQKKAFYVKNKCYPNRRKPGKKFECLITKQNKIINQNYQKQENKINPENKSNNKETDKESKTVITSKRIAIQK